VSVLLPVLLVGMTVVLTGLALTTLWWMLHAWRDLDTLEETGFVRAQDGTPQLSFSLLVPARHEQAVLEQTLERLLQLDHSSFEVLPIIGHDDAETMAVARAVESRHPDRVRVVVDHSWPKNKPKGLNSALPHCRGEVVGVFDAEDEVDPRLLRVVDAAFRADGDDPRRVDVVQGGVQLVNFRSSWFSLRNCLEYFFWFRSRLHLQQRHGFIPLGGNTVFIRTEVLREHGGYDPECLAEDCELGVRLSVAGHRIEVCYDAHLVTREETPDTIGSLLKQRTRWNQGFLQVYRKGLWRRLPHPRQRLLARWTLCQPFLQAFTGVAVPVALVTALLTDVPVGLALLTWVPAVPTLLMLSFELVGLREFCRVYYVRPRLRDYVVLVLGTFPYALVLGAAALRAVWREARGQRGWEKTSHAGAHRTSAALDTAPVPTVPVGAVR
jgi:cellulose synthase/poly-beta-1,6-N-acetylglucosamine synthase-like glycosyltransferase